MLGQGEHYEEFGGMPVAVEFSLDSYPGPAREVGSLRYRSGWLMVSRATMETSFSSWCAPLLACINENGDTISTWLASKFFEMRCSLPRAVEDVPPIELELVTDALYWDFVGTCDLKHLEMLEEKEAQAEAEILRLEARSQQVLAQVDRHVAELRRSMRRGELAPDAREASADHIAQVLQKQVEAESWLHDRIAEIRRGVGQFEEAVFDSLQHHGQLEQLFVVHWTARHTRDRRADFSSVPAWTYEQKLDIAPAQFMPSASSYQRVRWRERHTADSRRNALPARISYDRREAEKAKELAYRASKASDDMHYLQSSPGKSGSKSTRPATRLTKQERETRFQQQLAALREQREERDVATKATQSGLRVEGDAEMQTGSRNSAGLEVFEHEKERKRAVARRLREKREAYKARKELEKALADQPAQNSEAHTGEGHGGDFAGGQGGETAAGIATAQALQFALEEQRRRAEMVAHGRETDGEGPKRREPSKQGRRLTR